MDETVLRGMAKWPDVPAVYGWLALDGRGNWLIRGERIGNPLLAAYIGRNYGCDPEGCWYFQNGPQRVFVELAYTPFILRVRPGCGTPPVLATHNGWPVTTVKGAWLDEAGALLLETEHGVGVVHDQDLEYLAGCFADAAGAPVDEDELDRRLEQLARGTDAPLVLEAGGVRLRLHSIAAREVPRRFGFNPRPQPARETAERGS